MEEYEKKGKDLFEIMEEKNIEEAYILKQNYYNMAKEITEFFDNRSPDGSWKLGKVSPIILGIIDKYAY